MADQRFPRAARLVAKAQFDAAFEAASRFRSRHFRVHVRVTGEPARLGLALAKRVVPHAVDRNRIKRHARETFRAMRAALAGHDLVLVVHAAPHGIEGRALASELAELYARATAPR